MSKFIGMLIDDSEENYNTYARFIMSRDIDVLPFFDLPDDVESLYDMIIEKNVDFIIIDKELGEQAVNYNGLDVLRAIRRKDKEIYIIFLTNNDIGNDMKELGEFDQIIKKKNFATEFEMIIKRLERGISRDLSIKMEREIEEANQQRQAFLDRQIDILKDKLDKMRK